MANSPCQAPRTMVRNRMSVKTALLKAGAYLPYGLVNRMLMGVYRIPFVQKVLFKRRLGLLTMVSEEIGSTCPPERSITRHLACNILMPWRVAALSRCSDGVYEKWVRISHAERYENACRSGRGVLLASSHIGAGRMVTLALMRSGYKLTSLEPQHYLKKMGARGAEQVQVLNLRGKGKFWLKELVLAKNVIQSGGTLHWAVDGLQGTGGKIRAFHGRQRRFFDTFAMLAISADAIVLPVMATIDDHGVIDIRFEEPLATGAQSEDAKTRTETLMRQYTGMLEAQWTKDPGNIVQRHLQLFPGWERIEKIDQSEPSEPVRNGNGD